MASHKLKKVTVPEDPCPDCGATMQEVVLSNLSWAIPPASFWSSDWKPVRGRICPGCGRIQLYGDLPPAAEKSPESEEAAIEKVNPELRETGGLA